MSNNVVYFEDDTGVEENEGEIDEEASEPIAVKIENSGFMHRLEIDAAEAEVLTWSEFQAMTAQIFKLENANAVTATYRLNDDVCVVDSDSTLHELLSLRPPPVLFVTDVHINMRPNGAKWTNSNPDTNNKTSEHTETLSDSIGLLNRTPTVSQPPPYDDAWDFPQRMQSDSSIASSTPSEHYITETLKPLPPLPNLKDESIVVIDMLVDMVFADHEAMRDAVDKLHELAERTNTSIDDLFTTFNAKLLNYIPKEQSGFSAEHCENCPGISNECRHLHYDLPPSYTIVSHEEGYPENDNDKKDSTDYPNVKADSKVPTEAINENTIGSEPNETDDEDVFYDALESKPSIRSNKLNIDGEIAVVKSSTNDLPPLSSKPFLTTAQMQEQARSRFQRISSSSSSSSSANRPDVNEYLSRKFATTCNSSTSNIRASSLPLQKPFSSSFTSTQQQNNFPAQFAATLKTAIDKAAQKHKDFHESVFDEIPFLKAIRNELSNLYNSNNNRLSEEKKKQIVDRILGMEVVAGADRKRVEELVEEYPEDIYRVVDQLVKDRIN
ncbi:hypothetical protein HK100_005449 [Physocladia obscura]|uniref:PB1 domain-containing protein n=1 Tax=Physocladia obscura TaxID=109957 RepID=A0AAD5SXB7_9FUNG|nr:hypothetical protein HK100_005449 [Physocladia obscura]